MTVKKDLLVLVYAPNPCVTEVVDISDRRVVDGGIIIDLAAGTWTDSTGRVRKLGQARYLEHGQSNAVIGVYDRSELRQISSMVHHAVDAVRSMVHSIDED